MAQESFWTEGIIAAEGARSVRARRIIKYEDETTKLEARARGDKIPGQRAVRVEEELQGKLAGKYGTRSAMLH